MAYSELANWDGSLSSTNPTNPPKTAPRHHAPASGSTSRVQATNYASGIAKEHQMISANAPIRGDSSRRGEVVAAELRTAATRPTTVNAVAYGFGNDQTLLDSGCVPLKNDIGLNMDKVDKLNSGPQHAADGNTVAKAYPKPGGGTGAPAPLPDTSKQSGSMIIKTIRPAVGPAATSESTSRSSPSILIKTTESSSVIEERPEASSQSPKYPELFQILKGTITALPSASSPPPSAPNSAEIATAPEGSPITRKSSKLGDRRHSDPSASTPTTSMHPSPKGDAHIISRKKLKFDGVYLPPIELDRDLYKPLSSYFPLEHSRLPVPRAPSPRLDPTSQPATSDSRNDDAGRSTVSTPNEASVDGDTIVAVRWTEVITGLSASSPIIVDHSSYSSEDGEYLPDEKPVVYGPKRKRLAKPQFASTSNNPDPPSVVRSPRTRREDSPVSTIVVNNSKKAISESQHKNNEGADTIQIPSPWKKSAILLGPTETGVSSMSSAAASGKGKSRAQYDFDFEDDIDETCHQCRQKNIYAKMKCCKIKHDKVCSASFCHRCIVLRYPELEFVADAVNFVCPKCLGSCSCDKCCAARNIEYVPSSRSRKRLDGVPLLLSQAETKRREDAERASQPAKNTKKKNTSGEKRGPRTSRIKANIGEEAEAWLRAQEKVTKPSGRTVRRTFIGEWSKAWGAPPSRIREMECAAFETDARTQPTLIHNKADDNSRRKHLYIGEPVNQLLRRFKEKNKNHADKPIPDLIPVSQTIGPLVEMRRETFQADQDPSGSKRRRLDPVHSTPGIPEFTFNNRDSEAASSSTSSLTRLVTPSDSVFDYNACLLPSLRHSRQDGYEVPMLGSINQHDEPNGLELDLHTISLDHAEPAFTNEYNTYNGQVPSDYLRKPFQEPAQAFGIGDDAMTLLGETMSDSQFSVPFSGEPVIYGMPSYTGLTADDIARVARMALASISNPAL